MAAFQGQLANPNDFLNFQAYGTIVLAVSASSQTATFTSTASLGATSVLIYNAGTAVVFVAFGLSTATAVIPSGTTEVAGATPVAPGAIMVLNKGINYAAVAVIAAASTGNVYITAGVGA